MNPNRQFWLYASIIAVLLLAVLTTTCKGADYFRIISITPWTSASDSVQVFIPGTTSNQDRPRLVTTLNSTDDTWISVRYQNRAYTDELKVSATEEGIWPGLVNTLYSTGAPAWTDTTWVVVYQ